MWFKFVGKKLPIFYCLTIQCSIPLIEVLLQAIGSGIPEIPYFSHSPPVGWGGRGEGVILVTFSFSSLSSSSFLLVGSSYAFFYSHVVL